MSANRRRPATADCYEASSSSGRLGHRSSSSSIASSSHSGPHRLLSPEDFQRSRSPIPLPPRIRNRRAFESHELSKHHFSPPLTDVEDKSHDSLPSRSAPSSPSAQRLSGELTFGPPPTRELVSSSLSTSSHVESREELISIPDDITTDGESDFDCASSTEASVFGLTPTPSRSDSISSDSLKEQAAHEWAQYEERRRLSSMPSTHHDFTIPSRVASLGRSSLVLAALPSEESLRRTISLASTLSTLQAKAPEENFTPYAPSSNGNYPSSITTGSMSPVSAQLSIDSCRPLTARARPSTSDDFSHVEPRSSSRTSEERRRQIRRNNKKLSQVLGEDIFRHQTSSSFPRPKSALSFSSSTPPFQKRGSLDVLASGAVLSSKAAAILGISHPAPDSHRPKFEDDEISLASVELAPPKVVMGMSFMSIDSSDDEDEESDGSSSTFLDLSSDSEEENTFDDAIRRNKKLTHFFGQAPPPGAKMGKVLVSLEDEASFQDEMIVKKSKGYRLRKKGSQIFG